MSIQSMQLFLDVAKEAGRAPSPRTHLRLLLSSLIPAPVPSHRTANAEDIEERRKVYEMVSDIYIDFLHRMLQELSDAMSSPVEYADLLNYAEADRSDLIGRLMAAEDEVSEPPRAA